MRNVLLILFAIHAWPLLATEYYLPNGSSTNTNSHSYNSDTSFNPFRDKVKIIIGGKEKKDEATNTRTFIDGISELTTETITPLNVSVYTPLGSAIGNVNLQKRNFTETVWEFSTNDLNPEQNIFDERGRGVLVDGKLSCRITHRETVSDYYMAGMMFGMTNMSLAPGTGITVNGGFTFEKLKNNYWESSQACIVGPIPAMTTTAEIAKMCRPCYAHVAKTLEQDVQSRMNSLSYLVNTNLCKSDNDCEAAGDDGRVITARTVGRCLLVKDKNGSHYSECRTRSLEGRGCSGPGSYGMFEYPCDRGLECVKIHEGKGFWSWKGYDYSKYVCMKKKSS